MTRLFILRTLLLTLLLSIVSCNNSSDDSDTNQLIGHWYNTTDNRITSVRLDETGTGEATSYTFNSTWKVLKSSLQYTIANDFLIIKIDGEDVISGNVAITGKTLSFTSADDILLFTKYNGDEAKIRTLQIDIEENYTNNNGGVSGEEGETPTDSSGEDNVIEESFWNNEGEVESVIAGTYINLIEFTAKQLNLETIRITGKNLYGSPETISATSQEVEDCWHAGYQAINLCNLIIKHAPEGCESYINEAKTLRCFAYYNIAHLWGKAPYITEATDVDEPFTYPTILDKEQIFENILSEIEEIGEFRETASSNNNYLIDIETLQTIKGEIHLSRGDNNTATYLFTSYIPAFSLYLEGTGYNDYQAIFGSAIPLYTVQLTNLLEMEASGEIEEAMRLWQQPENATYGYWAMLKRTGKAQHITGCKEHEILMPIPENEIRYNKNITQNPGY